MGRAVQGRKVTSWSQEDLGQPVLQDVTPSGCMELAQPCLWLSGIALSALFPGTVCTGHRVWQIAHLLTVRYLQRNSVFQ